jgi:hypothetical protein
MMQASVSPTMTQVDDAGPKPSHLQMAAIRIFMERGVVPWCITPAHVSKEALEWYRDIGPTFVKPEGAHQLGLLDVFLGLGEVDFVHYVVLILGMPRAMLVKGIQSLCSYFRPYEVHH